jgi:hypothetical protein
MDRPDYENLRKKAGFSWDALATETAMARLAGASMRDFYLDPETCIRAYRQGRPALRELLGADVRLPSVSTPATGYGHVNGLGATLHFPEDGSIASDHLYPTLEEGIQALREPVNFSRAGMMPFYVNFRDTLRVAFPNEPVAFSWSLEGPITTAWKLRGEGFFTDLYDDPAGVKTFLDLVVESILAFHRVIAAVQDAPVINPNSGHLCDDIASMVPVNQWRELVLPGWDRYYDGKTAGRRTAHVEDLKPAQLGFLEEIGLSSYDPSVSRQLNPRIIAEKCRVPFKWILFNFQCRNLSSPEVADFVFQAVADGVSRVECHVAEDMLSPEAIRKVHAFIEAARTAGRMLADGSTREEIGRMVSAGGRRKFWDHWLS